MYQIVMGVIRTDFIGAARISGVHYWSATNFICKNRTGRQEFVEIGSHRQEFRVLFWASNVFEKPGHRCWLRDPVSVCSFFS